MDLLTLAALCHAGLVAVIAVDLYRGHRRLDYLRDAPAVDVAAAPSLSVVVAARNEAEHLDASLQSLRAQDYPHLDILVVDDRSTDATPEIVRAMADADADAAASDAARPRVRGMRVDALPEGWLGKNHALHAGAATVGSAWILFTDGDIQFAPRALRRAIGYAIAHRLDHLVAAPQVRVQGWWLQAAIGAFTMFFALYARPWRARDARSRHYIGVGAFNLVRADTYRRAGGHTALRLRPDDDMLLGKVLKRAGARQDAVYGIEQVVVPWYRSVRELTLGLEKNAFAGLGYSVTMVIGGCLGLLGMNLLPFVALAIEDGAARWAWGTSCAVLVIMAGGSAGHAGLPRYTGLLLPFTALLQAWIIVRATALTLYRGGIRWRDTFYPLAALRGNRV